MFMIRNFLLVPDESPHKSSGVLGRNIAKAKGLGLHDRCTYLQTLHQASAEYPVHSGEELHLAGKGLYVSNYITHNP